MRLSSKQTHIAGYIECAYLAQKMRIISLRKYVLLARKQRRALGAVCVVALYVRTLMLCVVFIVQKIRTSLIQTASQNSMDLAPATWQIASPLFRTVATHLCPGFPKVYTLSCW